MRFQPGWITLPVRETEGTVLFRCPKLPAAGLPSEVEKQFHTVVGDSQFIRLPFGLKVNRVEAGVGSVHRLTVNRKPALVRQLQEARAAVSPRTG
jgi:hypothetical protein